MSALSPRTMFLLDEACKPIAMAFNTPYLVGTAQSSRTYRDVDVRLILDDETYDRLADVGDRVPTFLGLAIGEYLAARTGLPIDFQIQRQTQANALHHGVRNPLGVRKLIEYAGDGGATVQARCTCPLREATTVQESARGDVSFVRSRSDGCPVHETPEHRANRIERERRRADAMRAARLAP